MLGERERYLLLNLAPGIGSLHLKRLLDAFGDVERVCRATAAELEHAGGFSLQAAERIAAVCRHEPLVEQELKQAAAHGVAVVTMADVGYPPALREIHDPPLALYIKGRLPEPDEAAVAIVGSRHASLYGLQAAQRLGYDLALRGVAVVSGLARGVDAAAHRGALRGPGRTFAVLGNGLASVYPPEHEALADQIAESGGLISEYPMAADPRGDHFPRRNRLISGFSRGVVVVEAAGRSGALITADCALEQGKEVFAVPGPITAVTAQGTNRLLKQGAALVTSADDILQELDLVPALSLARPARASLVEAAMDGTQRRVLDCVEERDPRHIEAIAAVSGLPLPAVFSALLQLELSRKVRQLPGSRFVRC